MALYHKWDVKNGFAYLLTFFSLISDGLGSVHKNCTAKCTPNIHPINSKLFLRMYLISVKDLISAQDGRVDTGYNRNK